MSLEPIPEIEEVPAEAELPPGESAQAHRKAGRYGSATNALELHLTRCPNDFEALMLLATIQADDFKEFNAAKKAIDRIMRNEEIKSSDKAAAEAQLKNWKTKLL